MIKQLSNHQNVEENLPKYADYMQGLYRDYATVQCAMNLYTYWEQVMDKNEESEIALRISDTLQTLAGRHILDHLQDKREEEIKAIHDIREEIRNRITILTSYTDAFQIHEYIITRLEGDPTDERLGQDLTAYADSLFAFAFSSDDKMVINDRLKNLLSELPVRITKNKFFDILNETFRIYIGSECRSVDEFSEMLLDAASLRFNKELAGLYPDFGKRLEAMNSVNYHEIDEGTLADLRNELDDLAEHITKETDDLLLLAEIVNSVYAYLLTDEAEAEVSKEVGYAVKVVECVLDAMANHTPIADMAEDCFIALEGTPEKITTDVLQGEGVLTTYVEMDKAGTLESLGLQDRFSTLEQVMLLSSNSLFAALDTEKEEPKLADEAYVKEVSEKVIHEFKNSFMTHDKLANRARMAAVFYRIPVFFNTKDEAQEYIRYAILHCNNDKELSAAMSLLDDITELG